MRFTMVETLAKKDEKKTSCCSSLYSIEYTYIVDKDFFCNDK